jgi:hypothetical protein
MDVAAMLRGIQTRADTAGDIDWLVSVDSTIVGRISTLRAPMGRPETGDLSDHALGRSRGRLHHEGPPRLRRARPPARARRHRRAGQRLHRLEQVMAAIQYRVGNTSMAYRATVTIAALLQGATQ